MGDGGKGGVSGWLTNDSLSASLSKSLVDELWSVDTDSHGMAFSYLDKSEHGKTVYCLSTSMHYSVLPPPVT